MQAWIKVVWLASGLTGLVALADGSPAVSSKSAESDGPGVGLGGNAHLRCPLAEGSLRHHGVEGGSPQGRVERLGHLTDARDAAHRLWDTALYDPDPWVVRVALNYLGNQRIPRELSVHELIHVQERISEAGWTEASGFAWVLANSGLATNAHIIGIMVDRFRREARDARHAGFFGHGTSFQGEAYVCNWWLRVFRSTDPEMTRRVLRARERQVTDERERAWLILARGMTGDDTVGEALRTVVEQEGLDKSTRALALRAYAWAMPTEAVELLERYKRHWSSLTHAERMERMNRSCPLETVAHDELSRLQRSRPQ